MSDEFRGDPSGAAPIPPIVREERERVVERLSECFAHDLIPVEEFEYRVDAAYRAPTRAALAALVADLAFDDPLDPAAVTMMPRRISAMLGNVEQSIGGTVPPLLHVRAILGNVEVDLSRARFAPGVTEIYVRAFMGSVEITLPPGVDVENHGSSFLGNFEHHAAMGRAVGPAGGVCVVRLTGRASLSSVEISS
ncbi:MAG TPA: DUF1707 domain-containing protein [Gemmatimonadaceae bacterium]